MYWSSFYGQVNWCWNSKTGKCSSCISLLRRRLSRKESRETELEFPQGGGFLQRYARCWNDVSQKGKKDKVQHAWCRKQDLNTSNCKYVLPLGDVRREKKTHHIRMWSLTKSQTLVNVAYPISTLDAEKTNKPFPRHLSCSINTIITHIILAKQL